jgi:phospholipase/carboxylesterase
MVTIGAISPWFLAMPASTETSTVRTDDYILTVPRTQQLRPLLVSLHGTDDKPSDSLNAWMSTAKASEIYLLCPSPAARNWEPSKDQRRIHTFIKQVIQKHRVDRRKIYLTGFSSGATMASILTLFKTTKFAALLLNSGHYPADLEIPSKSCKLAIHILHGAKDGVFPPAEARQHATRLRDSGFVVSYTELRGMGHSYVTGKHAREMLAWLMCFRAAK